MSCCDTYCTVPYRTVVTTLLHGESLKSSLLVIFSGHDECEMKVLLLGRFFVLAALAEWFIRGEYIRYLTEVQYLEMGRLGEGGGGY